VTKSTVRLIILPPVWVAVVWLLSMNFAPSESSAVAAMGIGLTISTLVFTHFHYKKWGPEITEELEKPGFKVISERPLTIFEIVQFADIQYFLQIISFHSKQIMEIEKDSVRKEFCVRIVKNYLSDSIKRIEILGEV
jgi:hypothetical protein